MEKYKVDGYIERQLKSYLKIIICVYFCLIAKSTANELYKILFEGICNTFVNNFTCYNKFEQLPRSYNSRRLKQQNLNSIALINIYNKKLYSQRRTVYDNN